MVKYEITAIFRALAGKEMAAALHRACSTVLKQGAVLRSLTNLGERQLPYRMKAHKELFMNGRYPGLGGAEMLIRILEIIA